MKAKTYLQQLQKLDTVIHQKLYELSQLQSELERGLKPISYVDEKVQTSTSTEASFTRLVTKKMDLENEINQEIDRFLDKKHEIINQIQSLHNTKHMQVLYKRYVEYKRLKQIACEMGYTYQYIRKSHKYALEEFERVNTMQHYYVL